VSASHIYHENLRWELIVSGPARRRLDHKFVVLFDHRNDLNPLKLRECGRESGIGIAPIDLWALPAKASEACPFGSSVPWCRIYAQNSCSMAHENLFPHYGSSALSVSIESASAAGLSSRHLNMRGKRTATPDLCLVDF
jgi:hypothetical protein